MLVTLGIQSVARELTLDVDLDEAALVARLTDALTNGTILDLTDSKGDRHLVPATAIGFVKLGSDQPRRVGFAL